MEKRQLITDIQQINVNAETKFLEQFCEADLQEYLARLQSASQRPVRMKAWTRPLRREYSRAS